MAGIGLVLNPRARRTAKDPLLSDRLTRLVGDNGVVRSPKTFEELGEVVEDFKRLGIGLVACAGGDGSNHITISGLVEVYGDTQLPYFAMLRGGTMNTVANSFGIPRRSPEVLLTRYLDAYARRTHRPFTFVEPNVLKVGEKCGFIFGTGAIYGFIAEYNRREDRTPAWAAQVLGNAIVSAATGAEVRVARRWEGEVRFPDGTAFPSHDYFTIGASTCGEIGLGFRPFHRSNEVPDEFHILGIHCTTGEFIAGLPRVWRGLSLGGNKTYEKLTPSAVMVPKHGTVPYTLDGDVYEHVGNLSVSSGPRIRIVIP